MANCVTVLGVHPIEAGTAVSLIEVLIEGDVFTFDFGDVTQESPGLPREDWQVAYDERCVEESDVAARFAFFLHYVDVDRPLLTTFGAVRLPSPTPVPAHLASIDYEEP